MWIGLLDGATETSVLGEVEGAPPASARASEPPKNIWFKRRVNPIKAAVELWSFRELIFTLAERDLRIRYKQAVLGIAWAVITPIFMMLVFTLIFQKFVKVNTNGAPYALFSYLGLLPWTFFSTSVATGGLSLVTNQPLLNKLYCPREVFPIAAIADALVDALIATMVLALIFPIVSYAPKPEIFYLPLLLLVLCMFTLAATMVAAALTVYMRDLRLVLPLVIQIGLFVTPVVYSASSISKSQSFLIPFSILNPLVPVIDGMRRTILQGLPPQWVPLGAGAASSLVFLIFGFMLFKRLETGMADIA